jgi:ELWxxDGT repeat protein
LIKNIGVISEMVAIGPNLFFSADDGTNGKELWISDGSPTGTQMLKDIFPGGNGSQIQNLIIYNSNLYFRADDGVHGSELWKSDGTTSGTIMLKDIYPGAVPSYPDGLAVSGSTLYFSAYDVMHGNELWQTDGTASGTMLVNDIRRIAENSSPQSLVDANGKLFFMATDRTHGEELWSLGNCSAANPIAASPGYLESFNTEKQSNPSTQTCFCDVVNNIIATVDAVGANPVSGNFTSVVLIENTPSANYVKKYYHILPETNLATATAKITLYFTQAEFDVFNALATVDLPTSNSDLVRIANLRVYHSLNNSTETINPIDSDIVWNSTQSRWEVTFSTVGFGNFAVITTGNPALGQEQFEQEALHYYPNPTEGWLTIDSKEAISSVSIFDILGKEVGSQAVTGNHVVLNLERFRSGVYFVMVKNQNKTQIIKVIKK